MIDALTAAAHMMSNDLQRMTAISQNLANAGTTAYKRQLPITTPFLEYLDIGAGAAGLQAQPTTLPTHLLQTDVRAGALRQTAQPFDIAIESPGYFEVKTEQGLAYTRRGDFHLDTQGRLVTQQGHPVSGTSGDIVLSSTEPTINQNGGIFEKDKSIGQLKIVHFSNPETLNRVASGLFTLGEDTQLDDAGRTKVRQGYLEASNVISMDEMVRLIETVRHYQAGQKIIQGYDELLEKALRKFGEF